MGYIDKVYVLNLPHRVDRRYYMMGHLHTIGVETTDVHFFPAKYHADFESPEAIIEAAIADDFPEFGSDRYKGVSKEPHGKFELVAHWGMAGIFRQVIEDGEIALVMIDDIELDIKFEFLSHITAQLDENYSPFYFLQCGHWIHTNADKWLMRLGLNRRDYADEDIVNGFIAKGTGGHGNYATVVSPAGAQILLDNLKSPFGHEPENVMGMLAHPNQDKTGMFHFIEPITSYAKVTWWDDSIPRVLLDEGKDHENIKEN